MKNTRSMPLRFKFKSRWRPSPPSFISFPESLFPDCCCRVTCTLGTRLPPSWDTEMRVRISSVLLAFEHRCACEHRLLLLLRLRLRLCRTCEPAFQGKEKFENLEKNQWNSARANNKHNLHITKSLGIEPGTDWWNPRGLTMTAAL